MSPLDRFFLHCLLRDESGQALPFLAAVMTVMLLMTGFAIDVGRAVYTVRQLQTSTDASAMAGAQALPGSNAVAIATQYSATGTNLNATASLPNVTFVSGYPKVVCLSSLQNQGMACTAPGNGNAVQVRQQITLDMYFMKIIGRPTLTLGATATASMRGSVGAPYNVVIIIDSTASMNSTDNDSNCNDTRLNCALQGVQVLLQNLSPCGSSLAACGTVTNGNVPNAVDTVSLYTFPGLSSATQAQYDYDCSSSNPQSTPYTGSVTPIYKILDFQSDYRASDTATTLAGSSNLTKAVGGKTGCTGMQAPGGQGTFYAGVIYAAQAALVVQGAAHPGTQNVMIILSDGDASAPSKAMPGASLSKVTGIYPSLYNQCAQAVVAAQAATAAGTEVYSVAYGAASSGCSTDVANSLTPCQTMQQMASSSQYFYSDYTATGGSSSCISASQPTTNLKQIFTQIAGNLTTGRLIPDNSQ